MGSLDPLLGNKVGTVGMGTAGVVFSDLSQTSGYPFLPRPCPPLPTLSPAFLTLNYDLSYYLRVLSLGLGQRLLGSVCFFVSWALGGSSAPGWSVLSDWEPGGAVGSGNSIKLNGPDPSPGHTARLSACPLALVWSNETSLGVHNAPIRPTLQLKYTSS